MQNSVSIFIWFNAFKSFIKTLSLCYRQKNHLCQYFKSNIGKKCCFSMIFSLIKFCGKEFQNKGRKKSIAEGPDALCTQSRSYC